MVLYGVFWCDCIYEGGMSLISAHRTKKGAYQALRKYMYRIWEDHRIDQLNGLNGSYKDYLSLYDRPLHLKGVAWEISEIEV